MKLLKTILGITLMLTSTAQAEGFLEGTLVRTPKGYVKIEDVKKGDNVFSFYDGAFTCSMAQREAVMGTGKPCTPCGQQNQLRVQAKPVVGTIDLQSSNMYELTIGDDVIVLHADSKVLSVIERKYVKASEIKAGTIVINAFFQPFLVDSVRKLEGEHKMTNIEVADNHTFFVTKKDILVHNGPVTAAICAVVCEIIHSAGCGLGSMFFWAMNPAIGALYGAVCAAMSAGPAASCAAICLGMPTP